MFSSLGINLIDLMCNSFSCHVYECVVKYVYVCISIYSEVTVTCKMFCFIFGLSELSVSLVDVSLSCTVARNISKTVRLFFLKCEQMIVTDGEATQVIGKFIYL